MFQPVMSADVGHMSPTAALHHNSYYALLHALSAASCMHPAHTAAYFTFCYIHHLSYICHILLHVSHTAVCIKHCHMHIASYTAASRTYCCIICCCMHVHIRLRYVPLHSTAKHINGSHGAQCCITPSQPNFNSWFLMCSPNLVDKNLANVPGRNLHFFTYSGMRKGSRR